PNPKQTQNPNLKISSGLSSGFEFWVWSFGFVSDFELRISGFLLIASSAVAASAAVAAASPTAAAAVAAASSSAATTAAAAGTAFLSWPSFIHGQGPATEIGAVQRIDGLLRFGVIIHFHKAEPA